MKLPPLVQIGGKLAIICVIAAIVLGLVNAVTAPVIVENRERALAEGLNAVAEGSGVAGATIGERRGVEGPESVGGLYPIQGGDGLPAGYVIQLVGEGYGGDMNLLAGYFPGGELFSAQLMENQETPGLGKKAESAAYMDKFVGFGAENRIPVSKTDLPPAEADAITGATITFLGVARALAVGSDVVQNLPGGTQ